MPERHNREKSSKGPKSLQASLKQPSHKGKSKPKNLRSQLKGEGVGKFDLISGTHDVDTDVNLPSMKDMKKKVSRKKK